MLACGAKRLAARASLETALGSSGSVDDFNLIVPGILIISIIMLMFTASIAFVAEVEHLV